MRRLEGEGMAGSRDQRRRIGAEKRLVSRGMPGQTGSSDTGAALGKGPEASLVFPEITEENLRQGVIWAEILGKPRARMRGYARRI